MKGKLLLGILALLALTVLAQSVHAYNQPYGKEIIVDLHEGVSTRDYFYLDSRFGPVRVYVHDRNFDDNFFDDLKRKIQVARTIDFLDNSANARYRVTTGKSSGQAFCPNCQYDDYSPSNFRYKPAYNPQTQRGDYYTPRFDARTQTWNWRF